MRTLELQNFLASGGDAAPIVKLFSSTLSHIREMMKIFARLI